MAAMRSSMPMLLPTSSPLQEGQLATLALHPLHTGCPEMHWRRRVSFYLLGLLILTFLIIIKPY